MENEDYQFQWVERIGKNSQIISEEIIPIDDDDESNNEDNDHKFIVQEITSIPNSLDQIAAENLIYMAQDGHVTTFDELIQGNVQESKNAEYADQQYVECQVTEEVITDDWVQEQGEERVEVPVDQICGSVSGNGEIIEEVDVPLPAEQDTYTVQRPYPCDFCSRRFRKKVSLMNHMVAHQNDRPNVCNLCGARYIRKIDLLNHLENHAHIPDQHDDIDDTYLVGKTESHSIKMNFGGEPFIENKPKTNNRGRKPKIKTEHRYSDYDKSIQEPTVRAVVERYPVLDPRKPFVCQQCGIAFAREKALLSHSRSHDGYSPYECGICSDVFWDVIALNEHQKIHHFEPSNSEYEPENDDDDTDSEDSKYGEFYCNVCGMSFHRQDLLKRHSKIHSKRELQSDGDSRHCCNVCGESFTEALDLLAHAEVHARFQRFKCTLCGESFLEEATIRKHVQSVHENELTTNSCRMCGKQCRDPKALVKHGWDHSREKNHFCPKCNKNFHNKGRLKRHMVSHRNKSVKCDVCHQEFPDGRSLMNHRHSHNTTSGRQFPCHECGKIFGSRSSQQIHIRIHTGERPYGCRYCWKAFADGGTLRKHERIHTGEKPYECSVCPRAFNQRVVLREHIRAHHSSSDLTRGTFFCSVCADTLPNSMALIQHLIHHSDMNTAMRRKPLTGPRKYKRRRKLKPHEIIKLRQDKSNDEFVEFSDLEIAPVNSLLEEQTRNKKPNSTAATSSHSYTSSRNRKYSGNSDKSTSNWQQKLMSSTTDDTYNGVFQNLENTLNNIDSLVVGTNSSTSEGNQTNSLPTAKGKPLAKRRTTKAQGTEKHARPKMIHTEKKRVAVEVGKRKTKTLITRSEPTEMDDKLYESGRTRNTRKLYTRQNSVELETTIIDNLNSNTLKSTKSNQSDLFDAQLLLEAATMRKETERFTPDVIDDLESILRSPIKRKPQSSLDQSQQKSRKLVKTERPTSIKKSITIPSTITTTSSAQSPEQLQSPTQPPEEDLRRSARLKRTSIPNKKYLEYDMSSTKSSAAPTKSPIKLLTKIKQEKPDQGYEIKIENKEKSLDHDIDLRVMNIKAEPYYQCEMCCATFSDRAQLLLHVPVHI